MGVRINSPVSQGNVSRSTGRQAVKKKEGGGEKTNASDSVDLSAKDSAVSIAKEASSGVREVDEAKVAELREQIAKGEYKADLKVVAERIISEAVVFGKKK
ncbi:MAG: flagellar biosynthesis anti-sigma factor FlgM [Myxococcota bacterium]|nr:flagellar biosynthesis anti-sigma factor FlgM [Myxococcota bacterium]